MYRLPCTKQPILSYAAPFPISHAGRKKQSREAGLRRPKAHPPSFTSFGLRYTQYLYRDGAERGQVGPARSNVFPCAASASCWSVARHEVIGHQQGLGAPSTIDRVRHAARPCALHASLSIRRLVRNVRKSSSLCGRLHLLRTVHNYGVSPHRTWHAGQAFDIAVRGSYLKLTGCDSGSAILGARCRFWGASAAVPWRVAQSLPQRYTAARYWCCNIDSVAQKLSGSFSPWKRYFILGILLRAGFAVRPSERQARAGDSKLAPEWARHWACQPPSIDLSQSEEALFRQACRPFVNAARMCRAPTWTSFPAQAGSDRG